MRDWIKLVEAMTVPGAGRRRKERRRIFYFIFSDGGGGSRFRLDAVFPYTEEKWASLGTMIYHSDPPYYSEDVKSKSRGASNYSVRALNLQNAIDLLRKVGVSEKHLPEDGITLPESRIIPGAGRRRREREWMFLFLSTNPRSEDFRATVQKRLFSQERWDATEGRRFANDTMIYNSVGGTYVVAVREQDIDKARERVEFLLVELGWRAPRVNFSGWFSGPVIDKTTWREAP